MRGSGTDLFDLEAVARATLETEAYPFATAAVHQVRIGIHTGASATGRAITDTRRGADVISTTPKLDRVTLVDLAIAIVIGSVAGFGAIGHAGIWGARVGARIRSDIVSTVNSDPCISARVVTKLGGRVEEGARAESEGECDKHD